jgi:hypothetical protein
MEFKLFQDLHFTHRLVKILKKKEEEEKEGKEAG